MAKSGTIRAPLRFGIMCRGSSFSSWQAQAIRLLIEQGCTPALLILDDHPTGVLHGWKKIVRYPYRNLLFRMYTRYFHHPASQRQVDMDHELAGIPVIRCTTIRKGYSEFFQEGDLEKIKDQKLDFILRFGFNIIRGEILDAARYGVWSFHHGDEQYFRGGPPGFWEIVKNVPVTGAILQRLTDRLDAGVVLRKGFFKTVRHSWAGNIDQLFFQTAHWPAQVANDIMNDVNLSWIKPSCDTKARIYRNPVNAAMILFIVRMTAAKLCFHRKDLFQAEKWNIGIIPEPVSSLMESSSFPDPAWLPASRRHRYAADPFGMPAGDGLLICHESFDYRSGKGHIEMLTLDAGFNIVSPPVTVMEQKSHLAYPFLLNENGTWYCIPERAMKRSIDLYKWDGVLGNFSHFRTLVSDIDAVDTTLFFHNKFWWLFFTRKEQSDTHLYAWFSKEMTGPYAAHQNNPIKTDVRSARPAGTPFVFNGHLIRPAQDCSKTYGGRIMLQRIVRLTPEEFEEIPVRMVDPFMNTSYSKGLHTLAVAGKYTIVDGKKYVFDHYHFKRQLNRKIRKLLTGMDRS